MIQGGSLQWPDFVVLGVVLAISSGIGIYYRFSGGRQKTAEEYFSANRSMSIGPLAIALMVSFMSAISLLGISAEIYTRGTQFTMWYAGFGIGTPIVSYCYLPVFWELQTKSVFEYLEKRFGATIRRMASLANSLQLLLYTGVVLYAPSLALEATTGLSGTMSICLIGIVCTFYSTIGGMKAVLITDVFQGILMFTALFCILGVAAYELDDGLSQVWQIAEKGQRIEFFDFRFDPTIRHTWWSLSIGGICVCIAIYGTNQVQIQRLLTVKNLKEARMSLYLNWPLMTGLCFLTAFAGLVLFAMYENCDPVASGLIDSYDKIMPYFAADKLSKFPGLAGLFVSGVFSASLSTVSAVLNSLSAIAVEDYIKPFYEKNEKQLSDKKATFIGKILAFTNGLVCLAVSFLVGNFGSLVQATVAVTAAFTGPLVGIFTLGIFFEAANETGALIGFGTSLSFMMFTIFGTPKPPLPGLPVSTEGCNFTLPENNNSILETSLPEETSYFYLNRISYMWYTPMGMFITILVGWISSVIIDAISKNPTKRSDPNLFTPFVANRIRKSRGLPNEVTSSQVFVLESNDSLSRF